MIGIPYKLDRGLASQITRRIDIESSEHLLRGAIELLLVLLHASDLGIPQLCELRHLAR